MASNCATRPRRRRIGRRFHRRGLVQGTCEVDTQSAAPAPPERLLSRFDGRGYIERRAQLVPAQPGRCYKPSRARLTEGDFDAAQAAWSPDGTLHCVRVEPLRRCRCESGAAISGRSRSEAASCTVSPAAISAPCCPAWSPDGKKHRLLRGTPHGSPGADYEDPHLWLVSRAGGDQRDLDGAS